MAEVFRQGDVVLTRVNRLPSNVVLQRRKHEVRGETGHIHSLVAGVYADPIADTEVFVEVSPGGALMLHPEHPNLPIPSGTYRVGRVRRYAEDRLRDVLD